MHLDVENWEHHKRFGISQPDTLAINFYFHDTLKIGQWDAIKRKGNLMQEGRLLPPRG